MGLRKFVDKIKPTFSEGGKLSFLHSTFGGFETFLYAPNIVTKRGAHIRDCNDIKRVMITVVVALIPALLFGMYNLGRLAGVEGVFDAFLYGLIEMLPMIVVSYGTGLAIEFIFAERRKHEVYEGFLVSGLLIPMVMPIGVPLWMVAVATAFAVIIGKEVFGGTGMNVFNPALLARAFAFFAYTPQMSGENTWFSSSSIHKFLGMDVAPVATSTGATPLANLADHGQLSDVATDQVVAPMLQNISVSDAFFGFIPGSIGETSTFAILIGAAILLFTGVASWRIMLTVFAGGLAMGYVFQAVGMTDYPAYYHLIVGGFAFGAVFMATDPVTSAQTNTGKWIYGLMVGALAVLIRVINPAYPEGMMLSILFMNALAPLIDYFVVERNIARRKKLIKNVK
ncbi:MAG: NADH:ubiquinone reductase (Na(+)-transporting) subunit B [Alistipes sp.]|nr:NADH:ubiquinone reductase (Na(+)-transporting) subunit B [Alistipes sp.]